MPSVAERSLLADHTKSIPSNKLMAVMDNFDPDGNISEVAQALWRLDSHRPRPYWDYAIDVETKRSSPDTIPPATLFAFVNEDLLMNIPTFRRLMRILMSYEANGRNWSVCQEDDEDAVLLHIEKQKQFLQACLETDIFNTLHKHLSRTRASSRSKIAFLEQLYDIWFSPLEITVGDRTITASLFERTFVGQTMLNEYLPFQNWLEYYFLELEGIVSFDGIRRDGSKHQKKFHRVLSVKYTWNLPAMSKLKSVGSMFIGTSPEFEMAFYTLLILSKPAATSSSRSFVDLRVAHANTRVCMNRSKVSGKICEIYPMFILDPVLIDDPANDDMSGGRRMRMRRRKRRMMRRPINRDDPQLLLMSRATQQGNALHHDNQSLNVDYNGDDDNNGQWAGDRWISGKPSGVLQNLNSRTGHANGGTGMKYYTMRQKSNGKKRRSKSASSAATVQDNSFSTETQNNASVDKNADANAQWNRAKKYEYMKNII